MVHKHASIGEAYTVLGLEQGSTLEVVKSTYKQLALKTHPDKNPGDADATAQFQKLSEAYNVLLKHLDRSSSPPLRHGHPHGHSHGPGHSHSHSHSHSHFNPFFDYDDYDDEDYDDEDDFYDEDYDDYESGYEEHLDFYMFLFEELLRGRANRNAQARFHHHNEADQAPHETPDQYTARLRMQRERQEQAANRRAEEEATRKANQERERERERREADERQRMKASAKKAEAETSRKNAEKKARALQEQLQATRSKTFAAARRGDASAVRKGVWEDNVDAASGEVRKGADALVKSPPADPKQTLLHIAAKNGDADLVEWLASHGAEPDERDGKDLTAFHVALVNQRSAVIRNLFESYPPDDEDYEAIYRSPEAKSNLAIALDTREPEMVWAILDKHLYTSAEMDEAWKTLNTRAYKSNVSPAAKYDELVNLFVTYGKYDPSSASASAEEPAPSPPAQPPRQQNGNQSRRPRPTVTVEDTRSEATSPVSEPSRTPSSASPSGFSGPRPSRGRGNRGKPFQPRPQQQSTPASPNVDQGSSPSPVDGAPQPGRGRGRGRGQYRGRGGRGRGRGQAPAGGPSPAA